MLATVANMERIRERKGATPKARSRWMTTWAAIFAYSPRTGERYSASPGDYFYLPPTVPLKDTEGEPMILAREISIVEEV